MKEFDGKLAVLTGGGSGIGRALALQLAAAGCDLGICDLSEEGLAETIALCQAANGAVTVSSHLCDVSDEAAVERFRDEVLAARNTDHVALVFSNAGIGGGGSFIADAREEWERTFAVCWYGVYYMARAFVPLLIKAEEGHLINTSSVNGFWATLGPTISHTSYSAAKFAVKGFSEALITDLRLHAPHVKVSVVMPGHIGTNIAINSGKVHGRSAPLDMTADEVAEIRDQMMKGGLPVDNLPDDAIRLAAKQRGEDFRDKAPTSAGEAATVILDGVREERWRILVGDDAHVLDQRVRANPEDAYELDFIQNLHNSGHLNVAAKE